MLDPKIFTVPFSSHFLISSEFIKVHVSLLCVYLCELIILCIAYKPVTKGTNGGVTLQGLLAATAGGLTIGLTFNVVGLLTAECSFDVALRQLLIIPISATSGLLGSLIDSLLGATLQFSGYCSVRKKVSFSLKNHAFSKRHLRAMLFH